MKCQLCPDNGEVSACLNNKYYASICRMCIRGFHIDSTPSSGAQGFDRRRQYEDFAQDVVQPWDAAGKPNPEFFRLYPESAKKQYSAAELDELKRKA